VKSYLLTFSLMVSALQIGCDNTPTSFALPSVDQSFGQVITYNNKVDILFVIDNSKSMTQHQQRLAARIPEMISALNSLKMDYHVAVTSTTMTTNTSAYPMSRQILGEPKYLTSQNINLLPNRLLVGESGSDLERGLDALAFVTSGYAATQAAGYLREDALFVAIFLADEDDASSEFGSTGSNDFVNYMKSFRPDFKEGGRAWMANYIGTVQNSNCDNLGGHVSIGTNYLRVVNASGGVIESICSGDLALAVSNIRARIVDQLTKFYLKTEPNVASIRVSVGGRLIVEDPLNGWTSESEKNDQNKMLYFIKFHGASIPKADEGIQIDYLPVGAS